MLFENHRTKLDKIASLDSILHGHFKLDCGRGVGRQLGNLILHLNHHSQTTMILLITLAFSNLEDQNEVRLVKRGVMDSILPAHS